MSSRKTRAGRSRSVAAEPPRRTATPSISGRWVVLGLLLLGAVLFIVMRYTRKSALAHGNLAQTSTSSVTTASQPVPMPAQPAPPRIDAARTMSYVRDVVGFGPRFIGTPGHKKTKAYIHAHLKGVEIADDDFTASTPAGPLPMRNIIAKFPGAKPGVIVIATHYDTLYGRKDFVGANDGASGTGLLLELASQLRGPGRSGYSVWLVWFDGEEAIRQWSDTDSTYGSRHLADKWQKDGTLRQLKAFLLADMIGDADLNIEREQYSTPWLLELVYQAATALGFQSHFFGRENAIGDDHVAFARAGVPVADLIDFDYGYNNSYWHTSQDTLDKLSPRSLEIVGDVLLESVALLDRR